jgi:hypothetical protein
VLDAVSTGGADPTVSIPDLDWPGTPQRGEPGRPHVQRLSSAVRSRAAARAGATDYLAKLERAADREQAQTGRVQDLDRVRDAVEAAAEDECDEAAGCGDREVAPVAAGGRGQGA